MLFNFGILKLQQRKKCLKSFAVNCFLSNPSSFQVYQKYPQAFRVIIFMIIHFFISLEQILWELKKDDVPKSTSGLELQERTTDENGIGIK